MKDLESRILQAFGHYKAEWVDSGIFSLFRAPRYFGELETRTPVVLEGGRGTGKTTVLRCMEYRGRHAVLKQDAGALGDMPYWAVYYRADTSKVRAFYGPELSPEEWNRLFSHYFNLLLCALFAEMAGWAEKVSGELVPLDPHLLREYASTLPGVDVPTDWNAVAQQLSAHLNELEKYVNNLGIRRRPEISMARSPVEKLVALLERVPLFSGRPLFVLIDEFENFMEYQQRIVNTFVKHCRAPLSYKIGVRPRGRTDRRTLNDAEILESPADFELIEVTDRIQTEFSEFALNVCEQRLAAVVADFPLEPATAEDARSLNRLLPGLSLDEEMLELGAQGVMKEVVAELKGEGSELSPSELVLLKFESQRTRIAIRDVFHRRSRDQDWWRDLRNNYSMTTLFFLTAGRRGGARRKFYGGVEVLDALAHFNIRFYLLLVSRCLVENVRRSGNVLGPVPIGVQTHAASEIGAQTLDEIQQLTTYGGRIKKLVLALGRVFQVMAHDPIGHTVEATCFVVAPPLVDDESSVLLDEACSRLALVRFPGSKPTSSGSTKDDEFMLHPIFAPFFETSYRRKRHITISPAQILGLVASPKKTIAAILATQGRDAESDLSPQLTMFEGFLKS